MANPRCSATLALERFKKSYLRWYTVGMRPTSIDLRKRVVAARIEDGQSMGAIAQRFKIPKGTVQNILERYRDSGGLAPKPQNAGRKPALSSEALRGLEQEVEKQPDATLAELRERCGLSVSVVTVHNALKKLGFKRKKKRYVRPNSNEPM